MRRVWVISECYFTGEDHIVVICDSAKIAEQQLKKYFEYLITEADEYDGDKEFIEEITCFNEALRFLLREPLEDMSVGSGRYANRFGIRVYDFMDTYEEDWKYECE